MASALIFIAFGLYLVLRGATADYLIDESDGLADSERKEKSKATPFTRLIVIAAGIASLSWGIHHLLH
jgi:hypothetical protein